MRAPIPPIAIPAITPVPRLGAATAATAAWVEGAALVGVETEFSDGARIRDDDGLVEVIDSARINGDRLS